MYVFYSTEENFMFIFYTLGISTDIMFKPEAGRIATGTMLSLLEHGVFERTKRKLLAIHKEAEVELTEEEFFAFCVFVDFVSRCFLSDVLSQRSRHIHEAHPFDTGSTFEEISHFYILCATKFFDQAKQDFADDETMITAISRATDWEWEDKKVPPLLA